MPLFKDMNVIYIHITKTAGSSIETALGMDPEKVEYEYNKQYLTHYFWHEGVRLNEVQHYTINEYINKGLIDCDMARDCFKFTFVRNPFDRVVSEWKYQKKMFNTLGWFNYKKNVLRIGSFTSYVDNLWFLYKKGRLNNKAHDREQYVYVYDDDGNYLVDFVGRFEDLSSGWDYVKEKTGVKIDLPLKNVGDGRPYWDYYNKRTEKIISIVYQRDLSAFGYKFKFQTES